MVKRKSDAVKHPFSHYLYPARLSIILMKAMRLAFRSIGAIPFLSIVGGNEVAEGVVNIKNLSSGEQKSFAKDDVAAMLAFIG